MELMTKEIGERLRAASVAELERQNDLQSVLDTGDETEEREIIVKYFTPDGSATWFILDGEPEVDGDWHLFGLCDLGMGFPELGYVQLSELQGHKGKMGLPIERDAGYHGTLAEARKQVAS